MNGRTNEVNHKMTAFLFERNSGTREREKAASKKNTKRALVRCPSRVGGWMSGRANARHRRIVKSGAANKMTRNECGHREWRRFENTIDDDYDDNHHPDQHHSVAFVDCVCNYDLYFKQTKAHHLVPYQNKQCSRTRAHRSLLGVFARYYMRKCASN